MRKKDTLPRERTRVVTKNKLNQEQLDEFAGLLENLPISLKDKELVAVAFCDHFGVKEKDRFLENVCPEPPNTWEQVT